MHRGWEGMESGKTRVAVAMLNHRGTDCGIPAGMMEIFTDWKRRRQSQLPTVLPCWIKKNIPESEPQAMRGICRITQQHEAPADYDGTTGKGAGASGQAAAALCNRNCIPRLYGT